MIFYRLSMNVTEGGMHLLTRICTKYTITSSF